MCELDIWINKRIIKAYKNQKNPIEYYDFKTEEKVKEVRKRKEEWEALRYILKNYYFRGENSQFEFSQASLFRNGNGVKVNNSKAMQLNKTTFDYIKIIESLRTKDEKIIDTMINWRHSGRISPLIDLTKSLKIALFFACIPQNNENESDGYVKFYHKSYFHIINSDEFSGLLHNLSFSRNGNYNKKVGAVIDSNNWVHPNIKKQDSVICFPFSGQISDSFNIRIPFSKKKLVLKELEKYNIRASTIFSGAEGMEVSLLLMRETKTTHQSENCKTKLLFSVMETYNSIYIENDWRRPVGKNETRNNFLNYFSQFLDNNSNSKEDSIISSILFLLETEFNNNLIPSSWDSFYFGNFIVRTLFESDNRCDSTLFNKKADKNKAIEEIDNGYLSTLLSLDRILTLNRNLKALEFYISELINFENSIKCTLSDSDIPKVVEKFKNTVRFFTIRFWEFLRKLVQDVFYNEARDPLQIPIDLIENMYCNIKEMVEKSLADYKKKPIVKKIFKQSENEKMTFLNHITLVLTLSQVIYLYKHSIDSDTIKIINLFLERVLSNMDMEENIKNTIACDIKDLMGKLELDVILSGSKQSPTVDAIEKTIQTVLNNVSQEEHK